jgi:hypothetical protein
MANGFRPVKRRDCVPFRLMPSRSGSGRAGWRPKERQVTCTATDRAGNATNRSFPVTVRGALDQTNALVNLLAGSNLGSPTNSLIDKLAGIQAKLRNGNVAPVCNDLTAFINEVSAQSGKALTPAQASQLAPAAVQIRAVLGSPCWVPACYRIR